MTCRIEQLADEDGRTVLRVAGHIQSEHVSTIQELIAPSGDQTVIDLGEITIIDRDVVSCLADCEMNGIELRNCPLFLREWLNKERSQ